jgi:hypothetical protein
VVVLVWGVPGLTIIGEVVSQSFEAWGQFVEAHEHLPGGEIVHNQPLWRRPLLIIGVVKLFVDGSKATVSEGAAEMANSVPSGSPGDGHMAGASWGKHQYPDKGVVEVTVPGNDGLRVCVDWYSSTAHCAVLSDCHAVSSSSCPRRRPCIPHKRR